MKATLEQEQQKLIELTEETEKRKNEYDSALESFCSHSDRSDRQERLAQEHLDSAEESYNSAVARLAKQKAIVEDLLS